MDPRVIVEPFTFSMPLFFTMIEGYLLEEILHIFTVAFSIESTAPSFTMISPATLLTLLLRFVLHAAQFAGVTSISP